MKIRIKLRVLALLMIFSMISLITFSFVQVNDLTNNIGKNQKISTPLMLESLNLQKDVIQIQQFLTDISATRAEPGFDDGFDEAKIYYEDAKLILDNFKQYNVNQELIDSLRTSLDDYYQMGITMANAYIESGSEVGNTYMAQFDPFADEIQEEVETLIADAKSDRNTLTSNINKTINRLRSVSIGLSLVVLIVLIFSYIIIKKSVLDRLDDFVNTFKDISEGEGDLTNVLDESSTDELGSVSKHFNSFIRRIHDMIVSIKDISYKTKESADETALITKELSSSVGQVASTTNNVASQTRLQTDNVRKLIDNINESNKQISIGTKSIDESVNLAKTASELTELGFDSMNETVDSFETMQSDINSSRDEINSLEESVTDIGHAIDIITNISYQINLLSLNASIEAARAGEHGKGFSVVSHEIGVLAEETKKATDDISDLIEKVQHDTKKTVASMELNAKSIISQKDVLNQGKNAIRKTKEVNLSNSKKVHDVSNIFNDINKGLTELTTLCESMLSDADLTQSISEDAARSIESQLSALEEVSSQMSSMRTHSSNLDVKLDEFIV